jgi:TRAP-type C4-dicarboxylate transport system permease large subunit
MFSVYIVIRALLNPQIAPREGDRLAFVDSLKMLLGIWPIILLITVVLVPIFAGWCTATESSGIGVVGAIILGKTYGMLSKKSILESVQDTTQTFVMLLFVVLGAMILANSVGLIGLPRQLTMLIQELHVSKYYLVFAIVLMYLGLGCLFDGISFMVMTLPFVFPIMKGLGFGGIWFGVLMVILIEIGQLTPPVGLNLFIIQSIAEKGTSLETVLSGTYPFFVMMLLLCGLIMIFPEICTFIPSLFGYEIQ